MQTLLCFRHSDTDGDDLNMMGKTNLPDPLERPPNRQEGGFQEIHRWPLPTDIRLERDAIRYRPVKDARRAEEWINAPGIQLLAHFLSLADADASAIARYARNWGTLGLCPEHDLPRGHPRLRDQKAPCRLAAAESLDLWRYYAKLLRSLLDEAKQLKKSHALESRNKRVRAAVDVFLKRVYEVVRVFGCLRPILVVEDGRFAIKLGSSGEYSAGLPAALTTQFLTSIVGAVNLATCASCGCLFPTRRRPRAGQDSFCENCGIHAAWRAAQQRRREKSTSRIYALRGERTDG